tara:strand:+ start:366 stop:689 length:324 start_codon:yes stop_codon:yes gene_type:complete
LEDPAHAFSKGPELPKNPRKKSIPPKKINNPNVTEICINNFFLSGIQIANIDKIRIGAPKIEGIKEVVDVLSLKKVTPKPHVIRKIPYITEIPSIFNPRKVNSTLFI